MRQHTPRSPRQQLQIRHPPQQLGARALLRPGVDRRVHRRLELGRLRRREHDAKAERRGNVRGGPLLYFHPRPRQSLRHHVEEAVLGPVRGAVGV